MYILVNMLKEQNKINRYARHVLVHTRSSVHRAAAALGTVTTCFPVDTTFCSIESGRFLLTLSDEAS